MADYSKYTYIIFALRIIGLRSDVLWNRLWRLGQTVILIVILTLVLWNLFWRFVHICGGHYQSHIREIRKTTVTSPSLIMSTPVADETLGRNSKGPRSSSPKNCHHHTMMECLLLLVSSLLDAPSVPPFKWEEIVFEDFFKLSCFGVFQWMFNHFNLKHGPVLLSFVLGRKYFQSI